ncbi:dethiobiotin synthase [Pedobacter sp. JCM 36344]|uniref:dethiobiotin synthase n=1 Tax=Pedobacter sp. JCM 36344 TaxID=3374280 RepID=UPI003979AFFC
MSITFFVTGIGTGIGKTIVSAILTEKLRADYWKPIQSGDLDQSDSLIIKSLISNSKTVIHEEAFKLTHPLSPHLSAKLDQVDINIRKLQTPTTTNDLIIEGAGGLMVPLNNQELIIDYIKSLNIKVILISQNYLGSINHTLLSIEALKARGIAIKGIIFNGISNIETERYIKQYSDLNILGYIPELEIISKESIKQASEYLEL